MTGFDLKKKNAKEALKRRQKHKKEPQSVFSSCSHMFLFIYWLCFYALCLWLLLRFLVLFFPPFFYRILRVLLNKFFKGAEGRGATIASGSYYLLLFVYCLPFSVCFLLARVFFFLYPIFYFIWFNSCFPSADSSASYVSPRTNYIQISQSKRPEPNPPRAQRNTKKIKA